MSNNVTVTLAADSGQLTAALALAKAEATSAGRELDKLARQAVAGGQATANTLAPALREAGTRANAAKAQIAALAAQMETSAVSTNVATRAFGLNRIGLLELQASGINTFQALAAGMSPLRVAMMEGAQVIGGLIQGGILTFAGALGALTSPIGIVVTGLAALAGGALLLSNRNETAAVSEEDYQDALKATDELLDTATQHQRRLAEAKRDTAEQTYKNVIALQTERTARLRIAVAEEQQLAAVEKAPGGSGVLIGLMKQLSDAEKQLDEAKEKLAGLQNPPKNSALANALAGPKPKDTSVDEQRDFERAMQEEVRARSQAADQKASVDKAYYTRLEEQVRLAADEGRITGAQEIAQLTTLENEKYALALRSLQEKLALYHQGEPEYDAILAQEKIAYQNHLRELTQLDEKRVAEQKRLNKEAVDAWKSDLQPFRSAFDVSISGIIQGTNTLQQAMARGAQSIVLEFANAGFKRATDWIASELAMTTATRIGAATRTAAGAAENSTFLGRLGGTLASWLGLETGKTGATVAGATARTTAETTAGAVSIAADVALGFAKIQISAATAAAAAFADSASLGPEGLAVAPGVAAAAYAATLGWAAGMGGGVALEVGAWEIPGTMAATLHRGEMVVPADFASGLRSTGVLGGSGGGNGGAVSIHIHAIDTQTGTEFLMRNLPTIAKGVTRHIGMNPSLSRPAF